jgi:hypothetical protein
MKSATRATQRLALFALLWACACGGAGSSSDPSLGQADQSHTPERVPCDVAFTAAFSDFDVFFSATGSAHLLNVAKGELVNIFKLEEGTSFSLRATAKAPLNNPTAVLADPVLTLVKWPLDDAGTCEVVKRSTVATPGSLVAELSVDHVHAGDYRLAVPGREVAAGFFTVEVTRVELTVPIIEFRASGDPQFIDVEGAPLAMNDVLFGFQAGKNLQVRYDAHRLTGRFPECILTDELETGDELATVFMGIKVNGVDRPERVQVGGLNAGDGTSPQPQWGDAAVPADANTLGLFFFCRDAHGQDHFDNNNDPSGGSYSIPLAR